MSERNLFEIASKKKFRFVSSKGSLSVEDLWTMPLKGAYSINSVAKTISANLKEAGEEDFVEPSSDGDQELKDKLDLVKYIIAKRLEFKERAEKAAETKAFKNRIDEIIQDKQDEDLKGKSLEDLKKLRNSL
ncbi:MAG: hypothetical protein PVI43_00375 [Candidatus Bathyarchaeota archaeon]|jgi:hypothetical protein